MGQQENKKTEAKTAGKGKFILFLLGAGILLAASQYFPVKEWLKYFLDWTKGLGPLGPVVLAGVYILACVLFLPGSVLTLGAGAAFGFVKGFLAVSVGSVLGAAAAFLVGRFLARDWVAAKIAENPKLKALDEAVAREGKKIVFLTRLSPVFPFNLLNFFYGVTRISLGDYMLASWIGMMPGTIVYVLIGTATRGFAEAATGETDPLKNALLVVGVVATLLVTGYVSKLAKQALNEEIDTESEADGGQ